ncbi:MAG: acyl carrier protein [Rhodospirillales bacterium]|jgi:acyl carrier protein|nr:acyl carrier protein [Rhodospirillales bacterium]
MLNEATLQQVMGAVLNVPPSAIEPNSSMDTIKAWDSLRHMHLVLALEEEFEVAIPDEEAANITSYALIKLVLQDLLKSR